MTIWDELKQHLIEQVKAARKQADEKGPDANDVGKAYLYAEQAVWERLVIWIDRTMKEQGAISMAEAKKGLVVQVVNLEDLDLRRAPKSLEKEIMRYIEEAKPVVKDGETKIRASVVPDDLIGHRSLAAYISRLKRSKKIEEGIELSVRKDKEGRTLLVRYS